MGIEPTRPAWKAGILPLNYTRISTYSGTVSLFIARNHLEYYLDGRCALIYLTRDEIRQSGVDPADLEELTSLPISIEGVKVGLTLRQQPGGSYRISVRTAKGVDACAIARRLGGGGHTRAAGCELLGDLENAKNAILAEVEAELDAPQEEA